MAARFCLYSGSSTFCDSKLASFAPRNMKKPAVFCRDSGLGKRVLIRGRQARVV